jgi:hypothetical protein
MRTQNSKESKVQSCCLCDWNWKSSYAGTVNEPKIVLQSTINRRQQETPEYTKLHGNKWPLIMAWGLEKTQNFMRGLTTKQQLNP